MRPANKRVTGTTLALPTDLKLSLAFGSSSQQEAAATFGYAPALTVAWPDQATIIANW